MFRLLNALVGAAVFSGVVAAQASQSGSARAGSEERSATAVLRDAEGKGVGTASLRETHAGVLLKVDFTGVAPGVHAFHVHERGRCDAPSFESAGAHLGRRGVTHGFLGAARPHEGDLPNIHVPQSRALTVEVLVPDVTLRPGDGSLLDADGSALVVHADPDDYASQPSGEAGDRIACGVIAH